ncbi:tetratricopeptide repeat protein [Microbacter sp. ANSKLAB05]|nr:tetratricopeptide repeat protein [Microbacter sp. ANSKLAB05]
MVSPYQRFVDELVELRRHSGAKNSDLVKLDSRRTPHPAGRPMLSAPKLTALLSGRGARNLDWDLIEAFIWACCAYAARSTGRLPLEVKTRGNLEVWRSRHAALTAWSDADVDWSASCLPVRIGTVPLLTPAYLARSADDLLRRPSAGPFIVVGGGGSGKTQAAAHFAEEMWAKKKVDVLVWVPASSRDSLITAYARAANRVVGSPEDSPLRGAARFVEWLAETSKRVLVVLDDLSEPRVAHDLWPPASADTILVVTTRRRDAALLRPDRTVVEVGEFSPNEATRYLRDSLSGVPALLLGADELPSELGLLPLALSHAVAYMIDLEVTCADYVKRFRDRNRQLPELFPHVDRLPDDYPVPVFTTWSISIDMADRSVPEGLAAQVLRLCSVLDGSGIPSAIVTSAKVVAAQPAQPHDDTGPASHEAIDDAIRVLRRFSLAIYEPESRELRVHNLVQRAVRESTPVDELRESVLAAAEAISSVWHDAPASARLDERLRSCVSALLEHGLGDFLAADHARHVLLTYATSLGLIGHHGEAEALCRSTAAGCGATVGPAHRDTLEFRHGAMLWAGSAGDYRRAARLADRLVEDTARALGENDRLSLKSTLHQIRWRGELTDWAGAVADYEDLVERMKLELGAEDPDTLSARNNLANARAHNGDYAGAATDTAQLLKDRRRLLGPDHPHTLLSAYNHCKWRRETDGAAAVITVLEETLDHHLDALGGQHLQTLNVMSFLGETEGMAGDRDSATGRLRDVITRYEKLLGSEHWLTIQAKQRLARFDGTTLD